MLATSKGIFIGRIGDLDKMHIRTIPFGYDVPQYIVHEPSLKVYAVACKRDVPSRVGSYEPSRSTLQILDDNSLTGIF